MRILFKQCFLIFLIGFTASQAAFAGVSAERITRYESVMSVARDSSATVTERITVNIEGQEIKRGIVRFFPVRYRAETGGLYTTGFELLSVTFDGREVPHELSHEGDYAVITIGSPRVLAPMGVHVYELVFRVTEHVRFLDDRDGIYWNVTGNQWAFPIDYASFRLELPEGGEGKIIASNAYTGYAGESGADFQYEGLFFETTRPLRAKEGFTAAVDWEKGVVDEPAPTMLNRFAALFGNRLTAAAFLPMLLVLYFVPLWFWLGRSPALGTVVPIFDAPKDVEPGLMAFARNKKFVAECMTSNLTQLAVLGCLKFSFGEEKDKRGSREVNLTKLSAPSQELPSMLSRMWNGLFRHNEDSAVSMSSRGKDGERLAETYRSVVSGYKSREDMGFLFDEDSKQVKLFRRNRTQSWTIGALFAVSVYFISDYLPDGILPISLLASAFVFYLFYARFMPALTEAGVEMTRRIEGLRMYVNAERHFLAEINAPEDTAEKYEEILPYAIALDAADKWNARFAPILKNYEPRWISSLAADILADLLIVNRRNKDMDRLVRFHFTPRGVGRFVGSAVWNTVSGTKDGASGGGSGGGGGKGW